MVQQPIVGQDFLIVEASWLHSDTPTLGRTPLDGRSAQRKDLTTPNTHKRLSSIPPVGFEPAIPASRQPQTYALDRAVTKIG